MSKSNWDKGFTSGAKAAREASANSVCTLCCDGCKEHGERVERERIIAILRDRIPTACDCGICRSQLAVIALIEGEK